VSADAWKGACSSHALLVFLELHKIDGWANCGVGASMSKC
jgi:hypothetical protein